MLVATSWTEGPLSLVSTSRWNHCTTEATAKPPSRLHRIYLRGQHDDSEALREVRGIMVITSARMASLWQDLQEHFFSFSTLRSQRNHCFFSLTGKHILTRFIFGPCQFAKVAPVWSSLSGCLRIVQFLPQHWHVSPTTVHKVHNMKQSAQNPPDFSFLSCFQKVLFQKGLKDAFDQGTLDSQPKCAFLNSCFEQLIRWATDNTTQGLLQFLLNCLIASGQWETAKAKAPDLKNCLGRKGLTVENTCKITNIQTGRCDCGWGSQRACLENQGGQQKEISAQFFGTWGNTQTQNRLNTSNQFSSPNTQ